jgi:hypothetical protein
VDDEKYNYVFERFYNEIIQCHTKHKARRLWRKYCKFFVDDAFDFRDFHQELDIIFYNSIREVLNVECLGASHEKLCDLFITKRLIIFKRFGSRCLDFVRAKLSKYNAKRQPEARYHRMKYIKRNGTTSERIEAVDDEYSEQTFQIQDFDAPDLSNPELELLAKETMAQLPECALDTTISPQKLYRLRKKITKK